MTTSTLTAATASGQPTASTGRPGRHAQHTRITAALGQYAQSQAGYAILPEPARHTVLEIGDRLQGLQGSASPGRARPRAGAKS